jgi:hypothetical protein
VPIQILHILPFGFMFMNMIMFNVIYLYLPADASVRIDTFAPGTSSGRRTRGRMYRPVHEPLYLCKIFDSLS